jgi:hypothetical protein
MAVFLYILTIVLLFMDYFKDLLFKSLLLIKY